MADAPDSKSGFARSVGSTPTTRTNRDGICFAESAFISGPIIDARSIIRDSAMISAGGAGGSAIFGPDGKIIDEADADNSEQLVSARLALGQYRATHRQPVMHVELYRDLYAAYQNRYPPNLFSSYLPKDGADAAAYLKNKAAWK